MSKNPGRLGNRGLAKASVLKGRAETVRVLIQRHVDRHGVQPTDEYLSVALGVSLAKVRQYRQAGR